MKTTDYRWFEIWFEDRTSIADTMRRNMQADLAAGYDPAGKSIREQVEMIAAYESETARQLMRFSGMEDAARNRWCYYDNIRRGCMTACC